jgi:hypothetical protein
MKRPHERKPRRATEPVQVYLDRSGINQLSRLVAQTGATKSEVLRRGLQALERQLTDPSDHPLARIMGIEAAEVSPAPYNVAREHDRYLADTEIVSWSKANKRSRSPKRGA